MSRWLLSPLHVYTMVWKDLLGASKESVHVILYRLKAAEHKKKKKLHPKSSSTKERQKYYDLILKRLEGFMES